MLALVDDFITLHFTLNTIKIRKKGVTIGNELIFRRETLDTFDPKWNVYRVIHYCNSSIRSWVLSSTYTHKRYWLLFKDLWCNIYILLIANETKVFVFSQPENLQRDLCLFSRMITRIVPLDLVMIGFVAWETQICQQEAKSVEG